MKFLVLGATGYIGSYLYHRLIRDGYNVVGTGHKIKENDKLLFYDIQNSDIDSVLPKTDNEDRTAIICIAESRIDRCYENYDQAYEINVTSSIRLIQRLVLNGYKIIYFSSDNVFNGLSGNYTEESPKSPINKYGMMKAEMEQYLLENVPEACILRISKVVSTFKTEQNIFTEWEKKIAVGKVDCIRGNRLSFICIDDIYYACLLAAEKNLKGLYNVAGDNTYSRAELARKFYDKKGVTKVDVFECPAEEFMFKDNRALNLKMSNQKFKDATGYQFMNMDYAIEQYLES